MVYSFSNVVVCFLRPLFIGVCFVNYGVAPPPVMALKKFTLSFGFRTMHIIFRTCSRVNIATATYVNIANRKHYLSAFYFYLVCILKIFMAGGMALKARAASGGLRP